LKKDVDGRPKAGHDKRSMSSASSSFTQQKPDLRAAALARRDALSAPERQAGAEAIATRGFPISISPGQIVSGFMPMKTELNPMPLMRKLAAAGAQLALPVIDRRGTPLIMRAFKIGDALKGGQWGIREPLPEAPQVDPDILIVPMAAFDRAGHRIGYGAGYYDMTIRALRARKKVVAVGVAFAVQEIPRVPATERDERLDFLMTERETISFGQT
jgi:5-formyltetrahydrofolate cyclo-ligase